MESDTSYIIVVVSLLVHLIVAWRTQVFINRCRLNDSQKRINSLLNWLIPFIWPLVIKTMIKPSKNLVTIKKDRKLKTGAPGGESVAGSSLGD